MGEKHRWTLNLVALFTVSYLDRASADWPMNRHDPQRGATATLHSALAKPAVRWRHYLGGSLFPQQYLAYDVVGDGLLEILYLVGGRLVAKTPLDGLIYESAILDLNRIDGITDLDGDGREEIVVTAAAGRVHALDVLTGQTVWSLPAGIVGTVGSVRLADFSLDGRLDIYLSENACGSPGSLGDVGIVYRFETALDSLEGIEVLTLERGVRDYICGAGDTIADLDGDGVPEIVIQGNASFYVFSGVDGALEGSGLVGSIPYGTSTTRLADVDDDGNPEILAFTNKPYAPSINSRRVFLLDHDSESGGLELVWEASVSDVATDQHAFGDANVGDLDGDGDLEVATSFFDGATDTWSTQVRDAAHGTLLYEIPIGPYQGLADLNGDGHPDVVAGDGSVEAFRYDGLALVSLGEVSDRRAVYVRDWSPGGSASSKLLTLWLDGDDVPELVAASSDRDRIEAISFGGDAPSVVASMTAPADVTFLAFETYAGINRTYPQILLVRSDGYLLVLDDHFAATNLTTGAEFALPGMRIGGYYSGPYGPGGLGWPVLAPAVAGDLDNDDRADVLVGDSRAVLLRLEVSEANLVDPPVVEWEVPGAFSPVIFDRDADSASPPDIAIATRKDVRVLEATSGAARWSQTVSSETQTVVRDLVTAELTGDATADVAFMRIDSADGLGLFDILDGTNGNRVWAAPYSIVVVGSNLGVLSIWDKDNDGNDDILTAPRNTFQWLDGRTGALLGSADAGYPNVGVVYDVDGDDTREILAGGTRYDALALELDLSTAWIDADDDVANTFGAVAACPVAGARSVEGLYNSPRVRIRDAATGTLLADVALVGGALYDPFDTAPAAPGRVGNITVSPDLIEADGADRPSVLIPSTDGFLYALDPCDVALDWAMDFRYPVGEAVLADTDADGFDEIIVSVQDGFLYGVDTETIAAPEDVMENEGAGPVLPADDLDEIETYDTLWANWTAVPGAMSYEVALITPGGSFLTHPPFQNVGTETEVEVSPLDLALDARYLFAVRTIGADGSSAEALSDGVRVVDRSAPEVSIVLLPPLFYPARDGVLDQAEVIAQLSDKTGLASVAWSISAESGPLVETNQDIEGSSYPLSFDWDGTDQSGELVVAGTYTVTVVAADGAGHQTTATADLEVSYETPPNAEADGGADASADAEPWVDIVRVGGPRCTCRTAGQEPVSNVTLATLAALLGVIVRRRARYRG